MTICHNMNLIGRALLKDEDKEGNKRKRKKKCEPDTSSEQSEVY